MVQPLRDLVQRAHRRRPARHLHLLGLGLRGRRERGVRELRRGSGPGGRRLDAHLSCSSTSSSRPPPGVWRHTTCSIDNSNDVLSVLGTKRLRVSVGQAADHRRAHVGVRFDPDDDPAHRAHDALDVALGCDPADLRPGPSAVSDADVLDASAWACCRSSGRCCSSVQPGAGRARRLDHRARLLGLLLLRLHGARVRRVLPEAALQELSRSSSSPGCCRCSAA